MYHLKKDGISKINLKVTDMSCVACENKIEKKLNKLDGIMYVNANYRNGEVYVEYDGTKVKKDDIIENIQNLGYNISDEKLNNTSEAKKESNLWLYIVIVSIIAIYFIVKYTIGFDYLPKVTQNIGYGMLFVIGLLTSIHCVIMCGGINISQCSKYKAKKEGKRYKLIPSILYNSGRVISYTIIGGIVGGIGSVISFSNFAKAIITIISGILMLIMGLNMLDIFPWLKKINPTIPKFLRKKLNKDRTDKGPFIVGLLNGLMPCGPLQVMQIYALGTGSMLRGALSMFIFSLGTVPLMFGLGALSSILNNKFGAKMLKLSGILVIILSFAVISRGLNLSGISIDISSNAGSNTSTSNTNSTSQSNTSNSQKYVGDVATVNGDVQEVTTIMKNGAYTPITVQKGVKVKWTIKVNSESDISGCSNPVTIPKYNIEKELSVGDNVIEFTPDTTGKITYTCWMGMVRSYINVVDKIDNNATSSNNNTDSSTDSSNSDQSLSDDYTSSGSSSGCCSGSFGQ